jgi:peptidoglycan/LPS O-acetylase OafA/YrhL
MNEKHRLASLDFLRGMAAFLVVIPHFFVFEKIGVQTFEAISILGVEIFFVLSGYVLAPQILFILNSENRFRNLKIFLIRRWMRTIPAYLIALICISVFSHRLWSPDFFRYLVYAQNLWRQLNTDDYFSIAWSLSVEEWFYITFPVFLILFLELTRRKNLGTAIVAAASFIVLITIARSMLGDYQNWGPAVRRAVAFRIDSIAYGFVLYIAVNRTSFDIRKIPAPLIWLAFAIIAVAGVFVTTSIGNNQSFWLETLFPFYAAIFGAACIICALRADALFVSHKKLAHLGFFLGRISYSVYLFHLIVLTAIAGKFSGLPIPLLFCLVIGTTVMLAYLMYTAIEAPILAARPRFKGEKTQ